LRPKLLDAVIDEWRAAGGKPRVLDLNDFSQAVAHLYDASMDVERWPDALSQLARIVGGKGAQIVVASAVDAIGFVKVWGWTDEELARFMPRYLALTPTDPRVGMNAALYKAVHCRQIVSDEVLRASDIYKQVLAPLGIEYSMSFTVPVDEKMVCLLSVMRGPDHALFTAGDCAGYSCFVPHVGRAVTLHGAFQSCREELATVKALLDGVPLGMMVVDDDELKVANRAARTLLDEGDAMRVQNGRLRGTTRRADAELRDAVHEARSGTDQPIGLALAIDHAEPMRAVIRRLHPASAGMLGAPSEAVALYVTDPRKPVETPGEILQRLFGLSAREASVLRLLVEGGDLRGAAARLGISYETVRTHVKRIMDATGARRQAELVRMVLSSPAWIAGHGA
jgi:DNA-binding CsgD family transcriptional regulator